MKILLVDDDNIIRAGMKKIILDAGRSWEVVAEAADGEMALKYLSEHPDTDLIITDVRMPIMDGLELISALRADNNEIKIIVLSGYDDYNYVRSAFVGGAVDYLLKPFHKKELIERIEKVENSLAKDSEDRLSKALSRNVLISNIIDKLMADPENEIVKELDKLGIRTSYDKFVIARVVADQYYKQFTNSNEYDKQINSYLPGMERYLDKVISANKNEISYCLSYKNSEVIVIIWANDAAKLLNSMRGIYEILSVDKANNKTGTIGISNIYNRPEDMKAAFKEADDAVQARFYLGQNKMIQYADIKDKYINLSYDLSIVASEIVQWIELGDYIKCKRQIEQIFLDLSYCRPDKFRQYIMNFLEFLCNRIPDIRNIFLSNDQDYAFYIDYLNTYRELKTYVSTLIKDAVDYIKEEKDKKSQKRIELAKTYIKEHYSEPITLNDIADYVELNASYFSNLFKLEMGENFSEYLLNIRMEKAKELLRNPTLKVYEIGNMVGYEDAVSFGRAFKKKFDMSPKDYRNIVY